MYTTVLQIELVYSLLYMQGMLDEADRDGDGKINQQEFVQIILKTNLFQ